MQRYNELYDPYTGVLEPDDNGAYVLYEEAQAEIDEEALRNAEFEQMVDEIKRLKHREKLAAEFLEGWADNVAIPDRNCSCHISPPCNDCYEWGFLRDLTEDTKRFIKGEWNARPK